MPTDIAPAPARNLTITLTKEQHDRLVRAYLADTSLVSKRNISFPAWAERILFDWVGAVEEEINTPPPEKP